MLQLSGFQQPIRKLKILNFNELLTIRWTKKIAKIRENLEFFFFFAFFKLLEEQFDLQNA